MLLLRAHLRFEKVLVMKKLFTALIFLVSFLFASQPHRLNFQGVLTDAHGSPVADTTYTVGFGIYDAEISGNKLWEESKLLNTVNGIYQTTLGNDSTLNTLSFNAQYYVQITVNSTVLPLRTKLTTVPYAISANNVTGNVSATTTIADGLVIKSINGLQNNMDFQVEGSLTMTIDPVENKIILEGVAPVEGIQGPIGPQGPAGVDGLDGTIGVDGVAGVVGPKGDTGDAGHGLKTDGTCNSSARGAGNSYANLYTCLDPTNSELWIYISGAFSNLGKVAAHPDTITKWNAGYEHTLPTNDSLHFTSLAAKTISEQNATSARDGYLTKTDFKDFRGAADSISILALQDTSFYNELVGLDTDIYDSISSVVTLFDTNWTLKNDTVLHTNKWVGIGTNSPTAPLTITSPDGGAMLLGRKYIDSGYVYIGNASAGPMTPILSGNSEHPYLGLFLHAKPQAETQTGFIDGAFYLNARGHDDASALTSGNLLQVANNQNTMFSISHNGQLAYSNGKIPDDLHENYHYQFLGGGHVIITDTATGYIYNTINAYITDTPNAWAFINSSKDAIVISHISTDEMIRKQFIPTGSTTMNFMLEQYRVMTQKSNGDLSISGRITNKAQVFEAKFDNNYLFPDSNWYSLPFNSVTYDELQGVFDPITYSYTVDNAGFYRVTVTGYSSYSAEAPGLRYAIGAKVNNVKHSMTGGGYSLRDTPLAGYSSILKLNKNDIISIDGFSSKLVTWRGGPSVTPGHEMIWQIEYLGN